MLFPRVSLLHIRPEVDYHGRSASFCCLPEIWHIEKPLQKVSFTFHATLEPKLKWVRMETTKMSKHNLNDQGLIEVLPMLISLEARGREDDWTGRSN
jgi:hypothetical protein